MLLAMSDEALPLANRCMTLVARLDITAAEDCLLVARIQCARRDFEEAARRLAWVRSHIAAEDLTGLNAAMARLVELQIQANEGSAVEAEDWDAVFDAIAATTVIDEAVEALYIAATWARGLGRSALVSRWIARAREISKDSPIWKERLLAVSPETTAT